MKTRGTLSAAEIAELHANLARTLDRVGVESQPEVALKLIALSSDPNAQLIDFARAIKVDHAITGRVLKLSNSAVFGQRVPVTTLERACLVLGLERLKSLSMGFYLTRGATPPEVKAAVREVWGFSVLRGCLCAELARVHAPHHVPEAFIVGLMMDAGVPIMVKLLGNDYLQLFQSTSAPGKLFKLENALLPYTHVDVMSVLARRWRLPELLTKPIEWHHSRPQEGGGGSSAGLALRDEPVHRLHRIAYVASLVELSMTPKPKAAAAAAPAERAPGALTTETPGVASVQRLLSLADADVTRVVDRTKREYSTMIELFGEVARGIPDLDALADAVNVSLIGTIDRVIEQSMQTELQGAGETALRVQVSGRSVEFVRDADGSSIAYLYDVKGAKLLSHRFNRGAVTVAMLCDALGLDEVNDDDRARLAALAEQLNATTPMIAGATADQHPATPATGADAERKAA